MDTIWRTFNFFAASTFTSCRYECTSRLQLLQSANFVCTRSELFRHLQFLRIVAFSLALSLQCQRKREVRRQLRPRRRWMSICPSRIPTFDSPNLMRRRRHCNTVTSAADCCCSCSLLMVASMVILQAVERGRNRTLQVAREPPSFGRPRTRLARKSQK